MDPVHTIVFIVYMGAFLMSVVLHEVAHGWVAKQAGDYTAEAAGRLSLNPIKHIDPFMSILLPIVTVITLGFPFGGAKPVPVNPYNFRNLEMDDLKVSVAGVAVNFALALVFGYTLHFWKPGTINFALFGSIAIINIVLAVFNLFPIPPLDGSHVMAFFLRRVAPGFAAMYERIGMFGILIIMLLRPVRYVIMVVIGFALNFFWSHVLMLKDVHWSEALISLK